jgi:hypothetical protein
MHSWHMKIETPLSLTDLEDRQIHTGHPVENQCSNCGVGPLDPWYPIEDVALVRHWTTNSVDEPGGGHWTWYCRAHLDQRAGNWWRTSHLAPAYLIPEEEHYCAHDIGLRRSCGELAVEPFDGIWLCEQHAAVERMNRRIRELMSDEFDDEDD